MKAILLARVSTEEQKEAGNSLPSQLSRLQRYCIEKKLDIVKQYNFDEAVKRNLIKKAFLHCHFDELSHNVLHNQIIKSVINKLLIIENVDEDVKAELRETYHNLREIDLIKLESKHFRSVQLNSNNYFYDFLLKICELIHNNILIDESEGNYKFKDFIRDEKQMAYLFEDFIRNFYIIELPKYLPYSNIKRDTFNWYIEGTDETNPLFFPNMQTDVSITTPNKKIIIEVKFYEKTLVGYYGEEKIRSGHLMQLFSYMKNLEQYGGLNMNSEGILLYPKVDKDINTQATLYGGHDIKVRTIDLNQHWKRIHDDLIKMILN